MSKKINKVLTMKTSEENSLSAIRNQMAVFFEENIKPRELLEFITSVNDASIRADKKDLTVLSCFGYSLLGDYFACSGTKERILLLESELPEFLSDNAGSDSIKEAIAEIGEVFLESYKDITFGKDGVAQFMKIFTAFTVIGELYNEYRYYKVEVEKTLKAA